MNEAEGTPTRFGMYSRANLAKTRMKKDIHELATQRFHVPGVSTAIEFPLGNQDLHQLCIRVALDSGLYAGGVFWFALEVPSNYPFHPPAVQCLTRAWHPSVDPSTGQVALRVLERSEWRPVLSINSVVFALQLLFVEPNPLPEHTANFIAATTLRNNAAEFAAQVRQTLLGGIFFGLTFPPNNQHVNQGGAGSGDGSDSTCSGVLSLTTDRGTTAKRKSSSLEEILETAMRFEHHGEVNDEDGAASSAACDESSDTESVVGSSNSSFTDASIRGAPQPKRSCCTPSHNPAGTFGNAATSFTAHAAPPLETSSAGISVSKAPPHAAASGSWQLALPDSSCGSHVMGHPSTAVGGGKPCPLPRDAFSGGGAFGAASDHEPAAPYPHTPGAGTRSAAVGGHYAGNAQLLSPPPSLSSQDSRWPVETQQPQVFNGPFAGGGVLASPSGGMPCGVPPKSPPSSFSGHQPLSAHAPQVAGCHTPALTPAGQANNPAPLGF